MAYGLKIPEQKKQIKKKKFIFLCGGSSLLQGFSSSYSEHSLSIITVLRLLLWSIGSRAFRPQLVMASPGGSDGNLSTM